MKIFRREYLAIVILLFKSYHVEAQISAHKPNAVRSADDPAKIFTHPPESAKPGVLWMWMGSNISREGITKDLQALKSAGFNRTTMFSLADVTTPWSGVIGHSPTPEIIAWTDPWWKMVRYAAEESKRLHMDFGMFNCPGYTASGGPWITPELSMQEICFSVTAVTGNTHAHLMLQKPKVDIRANMQFPVYNPTTGLTEKPEILARDTFYRDIDVLALPAKGIVTKNSIINISDKMQPNGELVWDAPAGDWLIYRFGHTTMGSLIQPAQPAATGLECDKISQEAIDYHMDHIVGEVKKHLGDLIGTGFTHLHFDSYEAGTPTWTPKMKEAFLSHRGYDLTPYLATFAGRVINSNNDSEKFRNDFDATIKDLYRDIYFSTIKKKLQAAHLTFVCEPYGGPWRQDDVMPLVKDVMTEFWTHGGKYSPFELEPTVKALRKSGQNIVEAEAFTGDPSDSKWDETPEWLKPIGDAAFCAGVNRLILHRFVEQSWDDRYKPGATMGRWGTHFDRTQTWWKPGKAMITYWQRCQALLQWGTIATPAENDFAVITDDSIQVKSVHRRMANTDIYFVANTSRQAGTATCQFKISGMQPELWDPVTVTMHDLAHFTEENGITTTTIPFDKAQSFFIVFRKKVTRKINSTSNIQLIKTLTTINGSWQVQFDKTWGGPLQAVTFDTLQDWINNSDKGIKYYSGTAVYRKTFNVSDVDLQGTKRLYLDLGTVKHIANVTLNGRNLGVVWTAPWRIQIPAGLLKNNNNTLEVAITNVWANRLIGDEQEPADCEWLPGYIDNGKFLKEFPEWFLKKQPRPSKGRYCFTTWNYFNKDSKLVSSGLLGPVRIISAE